MLAASRCLSRSPPEAAPRNLTKTLLALIWIYGGRGLGLLWTLVLIHQLGIDDYGLYGMAVALNAIVGPSLDNSFSVRAIRESEDRFVPRTGHPFPAGARAHRHRGSR